MKVNLRNKNTSLYSRIKHKMFTEGRRNLILYFYRRCFVSALFAFLFFLILCFQYTSFGFGKSNLVLAAGNSETVQMQGMKVTVLNVGQGLSILIEADGHSMIYDGGNGDSSSYVVSYIKEQGLENFDYMIASHYDEDHISGLIGCLANYTFGKVICPNYTADTDIYGSFEKHLQDNGAEVVHPVSGEQFQMGNAVLTVLGPEKYSNDYDNNNSLVVRITYGDFSILITGDAEQEEENEILDSGAELKSTVYVVGHHGAAESSEDAFVAAVDPDAAIISCGDGNIYGHPAIETMQTLEKYQADIYRTDKQDEICCYSDGTSYSFNVEPCADHSAGVRPVDTDNQGENENGTGAAEQSGQEENISRADMGTNDDGENEQQDESGKITYVVNTNTGKFHYPDCKSVAQMKESNKMEVSVSRDELISEGYEPCKNCNP